MIQPWAILVFCLGAALALSAAVASASERGIHGADDRVKVDISTGPWSAIGHVNIGGFRTVRECTGTRFAPGLVLTAAHCIMDWPKQRPFAAEDIHFVAGVDNGSSVGHSKARCVLVPDDVLKVDMAVIVLEQDVVEAGVIKLASRPAPDNSAVALAAYHLDRRQRLLADTTCHLVSQLPHSILTDCDAVGGSSGSPLVAEEDGEKRILGVTSAVSDALTYSKPVGLWSELSSKMTCD